MTSLARLFDTRNPQDRAALEEKKSQGAIVIDTYDEQCAELAQIRDPRSIGGSPRALETDPGEFFVEYPWRPGTLIRIVGPEAYFELRTNRNRELLTKMEQERFHAARVGFAGLNVGNPGAVCAALEGGASRLKLADFDPLSLTNLNRFRAGLPDLGVNKAILTARQILEIDPYYDIEIYEKGIAPATIESFLTAPRLDVLVEEMDALPLKIAIREVARSHGIPVVMVTGNGEGVLLDVERYDLNPQTEILNGLMEEKTMTAIVTPPVVPLTPIEKVGLARDFMGVSYLDPRLVDSFGRFGEELVGIPQLAESSFIRGAALCYAIKAIVLGRNLPSGRYSFAFHDHLKKAEPN